MRVRVGRMRLSRGCGITPSGQRMTTVGADAAHKHAVARVSASQQLAQCEEADTRGTSSSGKIPCLEYLTIKSISAGFFSGSEESHEALFTVRKTL